MIDDYAASRQAFRDAARRRGWTLDARPVPGTTPAGEPLTVDAAISPYPDARRVVVVSSGLHGVEGPFGAAVQLKSMDLPSSVRLVFVHGLNPFGWAWSRRQDADNVDPNRNFLMPGEAFAGSPPGYADFDPLLNPPTSPRFDFFEVRALMARWRHGLPKLKQALVVGQYDFPRGLFFGGHGPGTTQRLLADALADWVGPADAVTHLDFHTGLGEWATFKLLIDAPTTPAQRQRLDAAFGAENIEEDHPEGVAYLPRGSLGPWCMARNIAADYTYLVAEFGTYGPIHMLSAMRRENRAHHYGQPDGLATKLAKFYLREAFCPTDPIWRRRTMKQGVELVRQAVEGA